MPTPSRRRPYGWDLDPETASDADDFNAKLSVLKEMISHHAHEEEEHRPQNDDCRKSQQNELAPSGQQPFAASDHGDEDGHPVE